MTTAVHPSAVSGATNESPATIRAAKPSERPAVRALMTRAFQNDPVARWVFAEPSAFSTHFDAFVQAFAGAAFDHGTAFVASDLKGAALWLPPGEEPAGEPLAALLKRAVAPARQSALFAILESMGEFHPVTPHWYLPMIGVEPRCQGAGLGSALLRHQLESCDRSGRPVHLESSHPANLPLYRRHGFRVVGRIQHGDSPVLYPMTREPRAIGRP